MPSLGLGLLRSRKAAENDQIKVNKKNPVYHLLMWIDIYVYTYTKCIHPREVTGDHNPVLTRTPASSPFYIGSSRQGTVSQSTVTSFSFSFSSSSSSFVSVAILVRERISFQCKGYRDQCKCHNWNYNKLVPRHIYWSHTFLQKPF